MYQSEIRKADVNQKAEYKMLPFLPLHEVFSASPFPLPAMPLLQRLFEVHLVQTFQSKHPLPSDEYTSPGIQT